MNDQRTSFDDKPLRDIDVYYQAESYTSSKRVLVPAYERIKQLWSYGHTSAQILEVINGEFSDVDFNPLTFNDVESLIRDNMDEFKKARMDIGKRCGRELQEQAATLYQLTVKSESALVRIYATKIEEATHALADLDLTERDADNNFCNIKQVFIFVELINKLQNQMAKIAGTDALREIEILKQKLNIQAHFKSGGGLLPSANDIEVGNSNAPQTKFVD